MEFKDFGFHQTLNEAIDSIGFVKPTPIQQQSIPVIMQGRDLIASAQTGTGKTAAFLLPLIDKIGSDPNKSGIKAMVIVPTRELANQIDQQMEGLSYYSPVSSLPIYGGTDGLAFSREKQALTDGVDLVVCTPGRMIAHLNQNYVDMQHLHTLVLDEADRMLDMGFLDDIMKMISFLPVNRQTLLFSATMPEMVRKLAHKILNNPVEINIALSKPADKVLQVAYVVFEAQKIPMIREVLESSKLKSVLVFCSTKSATRRLAQELRRSGLPVAEIHSDLSQEEREKTLLAFRNHELKILVATDILSRGIDVEDIDLVINYDVPADAEDYIHRIGRTARAESDGVAITYISPDDQHKFACIEKLLGEPVHKGVVAQYFGETPGYNPSKKREFNKRRPPFPKHKK